MKTMASSAHRQVVLPRRRRGAAGFVPGHRHAPILDDARVEIAPSRPMQPARGLLRGFDTSIEREANEV
ncbi:MAG: AbrB/MazE/SpoVT family DNA-binding domain-containing protein [Chloroflexi bacterium]|jgi:hypothetical protein|nr:AbrB/MazE/SpoVT family DNA-binding domain-containing protein [Chloroflexota bacterium]